MQPMALWKRVLILVICLWGIAAAVPNLFYTKVETHNDAVAAIEAANGTAHDRFQSHSAFGAMAWMILANLRVHGAGIDSVSGCIFRRSRSFRL